MDRLITYPGQLIDHHDPMLVNRFAMIGLGKLAQAILGEQSLVRGLACEPTAPASLQIQLMPGEIYSLQNIDSTSYGDLPADTAHTLVKQGVLLESQLFDCPVPATEGHSVTHLIQVSFKEADEGKDLLPYYNASHPQQIWWGPDNDGKAQPTVRLGLCQVMLKAGVSAPTGSQPQPAVDVGYAGLYTITVAHGQSVINAEHIRRLDHAPFIDETLTQKISQSTADKRYLRALDGSIPAAKLAEGSVTTPKLAKKAVTTEKLQDGAVDTVQLAQHAVTADKLAPGVAITNLGYTPVQQGTGIGQEPNVIKIGWSSQGRLKATVDSTDQGNFIFESQLGDYLPVDGRAYSASRLFLGEADTVFHWERQDGQPSWLWGGNEPDNMYVYNPSNFRVNYANSAGSINGVNNPAWARARVQWDSGVNNFGTVSGLNGALPAPWVVCGLGGPGNGTANAISVLGVVLRNQ